MAVGDRYRPITPRDNLVFDADNNLVGVQSPIALGNTEMRLGAPLTAAQVAAIAFLVPYLGEFSIQNLSGGVLALSEVTPYVNLTVSGIAFSGACELAGWDCTVAAGNITIYDNTAASGTVIVPATALVLGKNEFNYKRALTTGCYVVLSGVATVNVLVGG